MKHLFKFEHKRQPVAASSVFARRLWHNGTWAAGLVIVALLVGMAGYMGFEHMGAIDAFANAAMILSGMGPLEPRLMTDGGKVFAGVYAIACGLLIFGIAGIALAPLFHRILHRFHVEDATSEPKKRK